MYVKSMVLEGFKSYGQKTEINGFDRLFNAITGLNGSGKSNILDAICFVLGLSNMSLARCTNLRDLIYKNGQTGVTRASVTITFDNRNKDQSPSGYEQYSEIVVRREVNLQSRTKYWINGFLAQNNQVADLFHSVQLNIQNPHFLIMQGRITKVLNMKPQEILAMVEEATGVSLYEAKKKTTRQLMEKKDLALRNIDSLINETIVPKLEQLKKEQSGLMEFQKVTAELEHLTKLQIIFTYKLQEENCNNALAQIEEKRKSLDSFKSLITEGEDKTQNITKKIVDLEKKKDQEFGGKLEELEEKLKQEQILETKLTSNLNNKTDSLKQLEKKIAQVYKNLEGDKRITLSKQNEYDKLKETMDVCVEENSAYESALKSAEKDFESISAGLSRAAEGQEAATLADQLMQAKKEISDAETRIKTAHMKLKDFKSQLNKKETESKKLQSTYNHDIKEIDNMNKEVETLRKKLEKMSFDEQKHSELKANVNQTRRQIDVLKDQIHSLESKVWNTVFEYKDPEPNFNKDKVIGVICNLFKVKSPEYFYALEKAVGGKLYHVVVDNEQTGKMILAKGQLRQRRTLIPLNKVSGRDVDNRALRCAERLVGKENVCSAISLVDFDPVLDPAMRYAFGDTLICPNMDYAKQVAFADDVRKRTVTLDGEVFDPSGTLSGGAKEKGGHTLSVVAEIQDKRNQLNVLVDQLKTLEHDFNRLDSLSKQYFTLKNEYELKARETDLVKERMQQGNQHRLMEEIDELKNKIKNEENILSDSEQIKQKSEKKVNELQIKMKDSKSLRERELKEAEQNLNKARKDVEKSRKKLADKQQSFQSLQLEIEELRKAALACEEQLKELNHDKSVLESDIAQMREEVKNAKTAVSFADEDVKKHKRLLKNHSDEIVKIQKEKDRLLKSIEDHNLKVKQLMHEISDIENSSKDSEKTLRILVKKNPWLKEERDLQEQLANQNLNEVARRVDRLKTTKTELAKTVNMRATTMLSDKEKESDDLGKRRKIITNDRNKLIQYMEEVDRKKKDSLTNAWRKINVDFGAIFSTFLPNSNAKLEATQGKTIHDGLEIRVAFGDVWKESLSELSGGQRSLVALSLILSLLKFNPAPLYILDEVDAALDQSHTQNTGLMIKKHFRNSQFIIVSLKDDMFKNANVLFKTKFEGSSTITRYASIENSA